MYRRGGIAAILAGLVLGTLFLVWPSQYQTGWVRSREEVAKVYVPCGVPYSILVDREFSDEARTPWIQEQCVRSARTRLLNIAVVSLPLLVLGVAAFLRGPYGRVPLTEVLRPLPELVWWRRRSVLRQRSNDIGKTDEISRDGDLAGESRRPGPTLRRTEKQGMRPTLPTMLA